jgi:hypothetical protein
MDKIEQVARQMLAEPCACEPDWTERGRHAPDCRWQAFRDYGLAEAVEAPRSHPGVPHTFHTACLVCGQAGVLHVAVITHDEIVTIGPRP